MLITAPRRRIYTALSPYLDKIKVYQAIGIWKTEFSNRGYFSKRQFLLLLCARLNIDTPFDELLKSLENAMEMPLESLAVIHSSDIDAFISEEDAREGGVNIARSFSVLLQQLGKNGNLVANSQLLDRVYELIISNNRSAKTASLLVENIIGAEKAILLIREMRVYRKIIHLVYIAMCEAFGPVKSDEILSDSVKQVENSKYGKLYSPSNFL